MKTTTTLPSSAQEFLHGKTADQIAKSIKLIFISDQPGEIANAIAAVCRLLASENRDVHWLAERLTAPPQKQAAHPELRDDVVQWCLSRRFFLSPRDRGFLENVARQLKPLSAKQQQWLSDINCKVERAEAA